MLFPERACSRRPTPSSPVLGKPGGRRGSPFSGPCRAPLFDPPRWGSPPPTTPLCYAESAGGHRPLVPLPGGVAARGGLGAVLFSSPFPRRSSRATGRHRMPLPCLAPRPGGGAGPSFFRWACHLVALLQAAGWQALCPCLDPRFASMEHRGTDRRFPSQAAFTSRWSERHAAYISGLGTFGLHKGLITEQGTCGRFVSVLTDLPPYPPLPGLTPGCMTTVPTAAPASAAVPWGHLPGGRQGPRGLRLLRGLDHGPLRPPLWLREMPGGGPLPVPQP